MSNVIDILERLGRDPLSRAGSAHVAELDALPAEVSQALRSGDVAALTAALQVAGTVACIIATPDRDEPNPDEQPAQQPVDDDREDTDQPPGARDSPDSQAAA